VDAKRIIFINPGKTTNIHSLFFFIREWASEYVLNPRINSLNIGSFFVQTNVMFLKAIIESEKLTCELAF
jgi:hypothetical protein